MEGDFPFYGDFVTEPAAAAARLRQGLGGRRRAAKAPTPCVILEDTLMAQFNLRPGDAVKLGRTTFTVIGALKKDLGRIPGDRDAGAQGAGPPGRAARRRAWPTAAASCRTAWP